MHALKLILQSVIHIVEPQILSVFTATYHHTSLKVAAFKMRIPYMHLARTLSSLPSLITPDPPSQMVTAAAVADNAHLGPNDNP